MPGIGVIYNPKSGHNLRDPRAAHRLSRTLGDHGVLREASSLDQLYRVAEDFQKLDIDVLGISGGDGTNGVTITGFLDVYRGNALPQIAFLRGGTMNTVANAVGVRRAKPDGLLDRLCQQYVAGAARPLADVERHVLRIRGEGGSTPPLAEKYGFLFGTGVVCGFLTEYYAAGKPKDASLFDVRPGPGVAAKTLLRGVGSAMIRGDMIRRMAAPFRGSVELADGTVWAERDYLAVAGGTIDQIGLNFRPFHRACEKEGAFHILGIHTSPLGFVTQLPRILRAEGMTAKHADDAVTSRVTIRAKGGIRYMIDGDLHECRGALHVSVGPRVRIVVGN